MPSRLRPIFVPVILLAVVLAAAAPRLVARHTASAAELSASGPYVPTEVLVRFRSGLSAAAQVQIASAEGGQLQTNPSLAKLGYAVLTVPDGAVPDTLAALRTNANIVAAYPNYIRSVAEDTQPARAADTIPTDPDWNKQYGPLKVQAPTLWDVITGTTAVTIAIIDTGVDIGTSDDPGHPDLTDKIWTNPGEMGPDGLGGDKSTNGLDDDSNGYPDDWRGWDFTSADPGDNYPQDYHGHGTHVAGIAGAETNNGLGVAGANWNAPLMAVRVLNNSGNGNDDQVISGIVYATDMGAQIINLSLGGSTDNPALEAAVDYAYAHGVLVVAAAGNIQGSTFVLFPGAYGHALAIANTDQNNLRYSSSRYGPEVDLAAPGVSIWSTYYVGSSHSSTYAYLTGTSMSTPLVSGMAALLMTNPKFDTPDKIRVALESTALDVDPPGWDQYTGYGIIQAWDAWQFDADTATPTPTPVPPLVYHKYLSDSCPGEAGFYWLDATGGPNTGIHSDGGTLTVPLPFTFNFNGQAKNSVTVYADGYLSFAGGATVFANTAIPNTAVPNDFIAPFWDDLDPGVSGNIYYQTFGSAPNRQFVVEWNGVPHWHATSAFTFQAVLYEVTGNILFQYHTLTAAAPNGNYATGSTATVGLEFANGTAGAQHSYNQAGSLHNGLAILFAPETGPTANGTATPTSTATPTPTQTGTPAATATPVSLQFIPIIDH